MCDKETFTTETEIMGERLMTKEMREVIEKYWEEDQHDKIVEMIMAVPEAERDIEMLGQLVVAYNNLEWYDKAIELSMQLKAESVDNSSWYYRIAYAYIGKCDYEKAADHIEAGIEAAYKSGDFKRAKICQDLYKNCWHHLPLSRKNIRMENEPLEIRWSEEDDGYKVVKGAVDLGFWGKYRRHQITVDFDDYDYKRLFSDEKRKEQGLSLKDYLKKDMGHYEIAQGLTAFFNARLQEIKEHLTQLNQALLAYLMMDMCDVGYEFWKECPSYVLKEHMPAGKTDDIEGAVYTKELCDGVYELFDRYNEVPLNDGADNVPAAEIFMEQYFPMFDYRKMVSDIYSEYLTLEDSQIGVQCEGSGDAFDLVCALLVGIRNDLSLDDWHNH